MANDSAAISWDIPDTVTPREVFNVDVTVRNTGSTTWYPNDHKLGNVTGNFGPMRLDIDEKVRPHEIYTFSFNCVMADEAARFEYQMLQENVEWFGAKFYKTITPNLMSHKPLTKDNKDPFDIKTCEIFRVMKKVDNTETIIRWKNPSEKTIYIKGFSAFIGVDRGGVCDTSIYVKRVSDGNMIGEANWDHYRDPSAPNHTVSEYYPDGLYKSLKSGEMLQFTSRASAIVTGFNYMHVFKISFVYPANDISLEQIKGFCQFYDNGA